MGRKKKVEYDDPEQSCFFIRFAEQNQTEDAQPRFEEAMKLLAKDSQRRKPDRKRENVGYGRSIRQP